MTLINSCARSTAAGGLAIFAPLGSMLDDPISQSVLETDVVTGFLRFDPFVLQNFLPFGLELTVKRGVLYQIVFASMLARIG